MKLIKAIIYWILFPFEQFLRFWFPYSFRDDPYKPEPQNKKERKQRRLDKKKAKQSGDTTTTEQPDDEEEETIAEDTEDTDDVFEKIKNLEAGKPKRPKLGLDMVDMQKPLTIKDAYDMISRSKSRIAYFWHDDSYHQIAVKFEPKSIKDEYKVRDDVERRKLKPLLFPIQDVPFDRTHIIPIGYHGSESDRRLLVGFNSEINQNELKDFEIEVARINRTKTILWFVSVELQKDKSALWRTTVWDERGKVLKQAEFHDNKKFVWLKGR